MNDTQNDDVLTLESNKPTPMPEDAKRVLVTLMRQGVIFQSQKPNLYTALVRYQKPIRRHLSDVYLSLLLDERQGMGMIARFDNVEVNPDFADESVDDDVTSLISKRMLTLHDTLILLVLRKYYQEREHTGEQRIIIDIERLESLLTPFVPLVEHGSLERKKLMGRIKEFSKRKLLTPVSGEDERYEITAVIRYVVSADFLEGMLVEYTRLADEYPADRPFTLSNEEES